MIKIILSKNKTGSISKQQTQSFILHMNQACLGQDLLCNEINFELYPFDFNKCVMNKILICHCLIMRYTMANASMLIMFIGGLISMHVLIIHTVFLKLSSHVL